MYYVEVNDQPSNKYYKTISSSVGMTRQLESVRGKSSHPDPHFAEYIQKELLLHHFVVWPPGSDSPYEWLNLVMQKLSESKILVSQPHARTDLLIDRHFIRHAVLAKQLWSSPQVALTIEACKVAIELRPNTFSTIVPSHLQASLAEYMVSILERRAETRSSYEVFPHHPTLNHLLSIIGEDQPLLQLRILALFETGMIPIEKLQKTVLAIENIYEALRRNGRCLIVLIYYKVELTLEMCKIAVQQSGTALKFVPAQLRTHEVCKMAVDRDSMAVVAVPKSIWTEELVKTATKGLSTSNSNDRFHSIFWECDFIPKSFITKDLCDLIAEHGRLKGIPLDILTEEMCWKAIQVDGSQLEHVPIDKKTKEMCGAAVKTTGMALKYVYPKKWRTDEMVYDAVEKKREKLDVCE